MSKEVQTNEVKMPTDPEIAKRMTLKFSKKLQTEIEIVPPRIKLPKKITKAASTQTDMWEAKEKQNAVSASNDIPMR